MTALFPDQVNNECDLYELVERLKMIQTRLRRGDTSDVETLVDRLIKETQECLTD